MPLSRRQFIKQFGVAGVVALAALSLRPEKALAGVTDNLTPNELDEIRKIALQNKEDISSLQDNIQDCHNSVSDLSSNLADGQISFSVVDGEPYVKVGADSPRPFKSGASITQFYYTFVTNSSVGKSITVENDGTAVIHLFAVMPYEDVSSASVKLNGTGLSPTNGHANGQGVGGMAHYQFDVKKDDVITLYVSRGSGVSSFMVGATAMIVC